MEGGSRNAKKSPSRNRTLCSKLKLTKRKVPFKHKKCYCLRFADFPQVWTELRQNQELCDGTIISGIQITKTKPETFFRSENYYFYVFYFKFILPKNF